MASGSCVADAGRGCDRVQAPRLARRVSPAGSPVRTVSRRSRELDGRGRARDPTGAIGGSLCPQARMDLSCVVLAGPACGNSRLAGGPDSGVLMRVVTRKTFLTCLLQLYSGLKLGNSDRKI